MITADTVATIAAVIPHAPLAAPVAAAVAEAAERRLRQVVGGAPPRAQRARVRVRALRVVSLCVRLFGAI